MIAYVQGRFEPLMGPALYAEHEAVLAHLAVLTPAEFVRRKKWQP
jgi:hypothetical protein